MTPTTRRLEESFRLTKASESVVYVATSTSEATTAPLRAQVLEFPGTAPAEAPIPPGSKTINQLIAEFERDPATKEELRRGRRWVAKKVFGGQPATLRVLRLRKGMSQAQLAEAIGTQQPHVARIEGGQADLRLETCRRIAEVLGVDLNTLDQALQGQGAKGR
jgi:DNA-binding XRE family transcriptional regulator